MTHSTLPNTGLGGQGPSFYGPCRRCAQRRADSTTCAICIVVGVAFPASRPRRLRRTPALRQLVRVTALTPADLVAPLFVKEGLREPEPVASMPSVAQHTLDSLAAEVKELRATGVS